MAHECKHTEWHLRRGERLCRACYPITEAQIKRAEEQKDWPIAAWYALSGWIITFVQPMYRHYEALALVWPVEMMEMA